jgi:hypothetical protein
MKVTRPGCEDTDPVQNLHRCEQTPDMTLRFECPEGKGFQFSGGYCAGRLWHDFNLCDFQIRGVLSAENALWARSAL